MFFARKTLAKPVSSALARFYSKSNRFDPKSPERMQVIEPWKNTKDRKGLSLFKLIGNDLRASDILKMLQSPLDFRKEKISAWWQKQIFSRDVEVQQFDGHRHASLGSDISIGHALLPLGVGLLYRGKPWMKVSLNSWTMPEVPDTREDNWILEAVDFSETRICFEGLLNFKSLSSIHTIKAQNCIYLDDWCLDYLCSEVLTLENLDLSGCKNISPKGLIPLTRLPNLERLDLSDCPAFQTNEGLLMCILLQDFNQNLKIEGVVFPEIPKQQSSQTSV